MVLSATGAGGLTAGAALNTTAPERTVLPSRPEPYVSVTVPCTMTVSPTEGADAPTAQRPCHAAAASCST